MSWTWTFTVHRDAPLRGDERDALARLVGSVALSAASTAFDVRWSVEEPAEASDTVGPPTRAAGQVSVSMDVGSSDAQAVLFALTAVERLLGAEVRVDDDLDVVTRRPEGFVLLPDARQSPVSLPEGWAQWTSARGWAPGPRREATGEAPIASLLAQVDAARALSSAKVERLRARFAALDDDAIPWVMAALDEERGPSWHDNLAAVVAPLAQRDVWVDALVGSWRLSDAGRGRDLAVIELLLEARTERATAALLDLVRRLRRAPQGALPAGESPLTDVVLARLGRALPPGLAGATFASAALSLGGAAPFPFAWRLLVTAGGARALPLLDRARLRAASPERPGPGRVKGFPVANLVLDAWVTLSADGHLSADALRARIESALAAPERAVRLHAATLLTRIDPGAVDRLRSELDEARANGLSPEVPADVAAVLRASSPAAVRLSDVPPLSGLPAPVEVLPPIEPAAPVRAEVRPVARPVARVVRGGAVAPPSRPAWMDDLASLDPERVDQGLRAARGVTDPGELLAVLLYDELAAALGLERPTRKWWAGRGLPPEVPAVPGARLRAHLSRAASGALPPLLQSVLVEGAAVVAASLPEPSPLLPLEDGERAGFEEEVEVGIGGAGWPGE